MARALQGLGHGEACEGPNTGSAAQATHGQGHQHHAAAQRAHRPGVVQLSAPCILYTSVLSLLTEAEPAGKTS